MTDHTQSPIAPFRPKPVAIAPELLKRRRRYDFVFYLMGRLSVVISVGLLLALFGSIFYWAMPAFITAEVALKIPTRALLQQSQNISNQNKIIEQCLKETYPHLDGEKQLKSIGRLYSLLAVKEIKQHLKKRSKEDIKTPSKDDILWVRVTAEAASFLKNIERGRDTQNSRLTQVQKDFLKELSTSDHLRWRFNWSFLRDQILKKLSLLAYGGGSWGHFLS